MGSDLVYSILSQNGTLIRPVDKVRYWTAVARLFRGIDLCRSESMEAGSMEEAGSGHEDWSQHTNVGCLAGFV
jgi:hypothetical protein